jgi:hypothetical protein
MNRSDPGPAFPALLVGYETREVRQLLSDKIYEVVEGNDSDKTTLLVDYRQPTNTPGPHALDSVRDVVFFPGRKELAAHQVSDRNPVQLDILGEQLEYDVPIGKDSYRQAPVLHFFDDHYGADVVTAHETNGVAD